MVGMECPMQNQGTETISFPFHTTTQAPLDSALEKCCKGLLFPYMPSSALTLHTTYLMTTLTIQPPPRALLNAEAVYASAQPASLPPAERASPAQHVRHRSPDLPPREPPSSSRVMAAPAFQGLRPNTLESPSTSLFS